MKSNIMKESSKWLMDGMDITLIFFQDKLVPIFNEKIGNCNTYPLLK